jgi:hypothetical protein
MFKGPKGRKRPAGVKVMKIATGEVDIGDDGKNKATVQLGRKGDLARARKMNPGRREEIVREAAQIRRFKKTSRSGQYHC